MKINPVTVGPILGATTGDVVRIWGRGEFEKTPSGIRRCFGIARMRQAGRDWQKPKLFKMNPNFDMTGIVIYTNLKQKTDYTYQIGWFYSDLEPEALDSGVEHDKYDWSAIEQIAFRTASVEDDDSRSFVFGSCRYLLRLMGGFWFDNRGDKTFRSILDQVDTDKRQVDLFLSIGDQIYADDLNIVSSDSSIDEFNKRYREAFTQPYVRKLMSRIPSYMTLDDHEIEDNWPAHANRKDLMVKYPAAIHAYQSYQASHSPLFELSGDRIVGVPERFWYSFRDGCCDFFVLDMRTERRARKDEYYSEIVSPNQMRALQKWLNDGSGRVKFVVSGVPFFPRSKIDADDKWDGYPRQQKKILEHIRKNKIKRVVFLSGDVHASFSAELYAEGDSDFKVISVISSPFFWPYPHQSRSSFILSGTLPLKDIPVKYVVQNTSQVHDTDNFTRVTADLEKIDVEVFSRKGDPLGKSTYSF